MADCIESSIAEVPVVVSTVAKPVVCSSVEVAGGPVAVGTIGDTRSKAIVDRFVVNYTQPGPVYAGAGLTKTGSTIDVNAANASIIVNPDDIEVGYGGTLDVQPLGAVDAGGSDQAARIDHRHNHGDLSAELATHHTASQVAVAGTYPEIGNPGDVETALAQIDLVAGSIGQTDTVAGANGVQNTGNDVNAVIEPVYGTTANTVTEGNDPRLSDARTPTGAAGGELAGTYPNPTVVDGADGSAIHDNIAGEIAAIATKATPVAADILIIEDSAAGNAKKAITVGSLPSGGGGITEPQHKALRDLIHFIDDGPADGFASGAVKDVSYSGAFPTVVDWWEDATRTQRIVDLAITYSGAFPTSERWRMYDTDGVTVLVTLTDAITYSGAFETSRTRTWV